jgi:VCBS repeat-containing protein
MRQYGSYGRLSLTSVGQWSYVLDAGAVQALTTGQTASDTFAVQSVDGTEQLLTFAIAGADETVLVGTVGNDVLTGTGADEVLLGLAGRDMLYGKGGADTLDGGAGGDSLFGEDGDDVIVHDAKDRLQSGGAGLDTLRLERGATVNLGAADQVWGDCGLTNGFEDVDATYATASVNLTGSTGGNALAGGLAADRLTGGLGADVLFGNGGADRFILRSVAESRGAAQDEIADFTHGLDRIDLSAIDAVVGGRDNGFAFIGAAGFVRAGQLRYDAVAGIVEGDLNGDLVADFGIQVGAALAITASDFVL